jgi:hypothetical protein
MMENRKIDFLRDLVALLHRHGPEPLLGLVADLNDDMLRQQLTMSLTALANVAGDKQNVRRPYAERRTEGRSEKQRAWAILDSLRALEPEKAEILQQFYSGLSSRKLLPTKNHILEFCASLNIEVPAQQERNRLLLPILRYMSSLSLQEIRYALERGLNSGEDSNSEYQRLADVIMKRGTD